MATLLSALALKRNLSNHVLAKLVSANFVKIQNNAKHVGKCSFREEHLFPKRWTAGWTCGEGPTKQPGGIIRYAPTVQVDNYQCCGSGSVFRSIFSFQIKCITLDPDLDPDGSTTLTLRFGYYQNAMSKNQKNVNAYRKTL